MKANSVLKLKYVIGASISVVAAILLLATTRSRAKPTAQAQPAPVVEVAPVQQRDVPVYAEWIGTLAGHVTAYEKAQVTGYLVRQDYKEGSYVEKRQLLFEIDPRPFQAALDQAKGQLAQARAQLVQDEAQLAMAQATQLRSQLKAPLTISTSSTARVRFITPNSPWHRRETANTRAWCNSIKRWVGAGSNGP
jgi:multidrug efflux pump subunit AcrA (membrane-fusion protein)